MFTSLTIPLKIVRRAIGKLQLDYLSTSYTAGDTKTLYIATHPNDENGYFMQE